MWRTSRDVRRSGDVNSVYDVPSLLACGARVSNLKSVGRTVRELHALHAVTCIPGGGGSGVELLDGNRKVAGSNPGSPRVSVEVSLSKTLNP